MEVYSYWLLLALVLLGLEMATGTFYLLMLSIAMAAGGLAAMLALSVVWQLIFCAFAVISGTFILRRWKKGQVNEVAGASLDVGQPVEVLTWHENGSLRVMYRGAEWDAVPEPADTPRDATFYIKALRGSSLVLTRHKP